MVLIIIITNNNHANKLIVKMVFAMLQDVLLEVMNFNLKAQAVRNCTKLID